MQSIGQLKIKRTTKKYTQCISNTCINPTKFMFYFKQSIYHSILLESFK